jgi:polyhydroxyalkanoate synthesis repressor PhaR
MRVIRRYGGGSRKLYDTANSRYVSLDDIAALIRRGERLRVADSRSGADVTAQTLAQVIVETEKQGRSLVPGELLHDIIRLGGEAVTAGTGMLRRGLADLDRSLARMERTKRRTTTRRRGGV